MCLVLKSTCCLLTGVHCCNCYFGVYFLYIEVVIEHFLQNYCVSVGDSGFRYHGGVLEVFYGRALFVVSLCFVIFFSNRFV